MPSMFLFLFIHLIFGGGGAGKGEGDETGCCYVVQAGLNSLSSLLSAELQV
jgi:hypothetical protein